MHKGGPGSHYDRRKKSPRFSGIIQRVIASSFPEEQSGIRRSDLIRQSFVNDKASCRSNLFSPVRAIHMAGYRVMNKYLCKGGNLHTKLRAGDSAGDHGDGAPR